jgi:hypothetical protein
MNILNRTEKNIVKKVSIFCLTFIFTLFSARIQYTNFLRAHPLLQHELALWFQCTRGTNAHALTAQYTSCFGDGFLEEGADLRFKSAPFEVDRVRILRIVRADLHTAPAQQALRVIADEHRVVIFDF